MAYIDQSKSSPPNLPGNPIEPLPRNVKANAETILDLDLAQFAKF